MINLTGFKTNAQWKFPDVKVCPNRSCKKSFSTRLKAIEHYKETHAMNFLLCKLCKIPVSEGTFSFHYRKVHPKSRIPAIDRRKQCGICNNVFINLPKHIKEVHSAKILCPLEGCEFGTKRMDVLQAHWARKHEHLMFPKIQRSRLASSDLDESLHNETIVNKGGKKRKMVIYI